MSSPNVNVRLQNYANNSGKVIMPYAEGDAKAYMDFYEKLLN